MPFDGPLLEIQNDPNSKKPMWAALHRADGSELSHPSSFGYCRARYDEKHGAQFGKTGSNGWGWVVFMSLWDSPIGGKCLSNPPLQNVVLQQ